MDGRLLNAAQERVNLATKIYEASKIEQKAHRQNQWFQEKAEEAGLEMDADLLDEGLLGGDSRDQNQLRQAKSAAGRLRQLLAEPIQTQRYGKFLSTNSALRQRAVAAPGAFAQPLNASKKNKKRRRRR